MMNCWFQFSTVDSYVMTGRDYIYSESMRVWVCVFSVETFVCVCLFLALVTYIIYENGGQTMTGYVDMNPVL